MSTWCIYLHTDGVVLVDAEVKYEHLPVQGDNSEDGAGVGGPGYVTHLLRGGGTRLTKNSTFFRGAL